MSRETSSCLDRYFAAGCGAVVLSVGLLIAAFVVASGADLGPLWKPRLEVPAYLLFAHAGPGAGPPCLLPCNGYPLPLKNTSRDPLRQALEELCSYDQATFRPVFMLGCKPKEPPSTAVPPGTKLRGLQVCEDLITVDLNGNVADFRDVAQRFRGYRGMDGRCPLIFLAQVVFTATGLHEKAGVQILIGGSIRPRLGYGDTDFARRWHREELQRLVLVAQDNEWAPRPHGGEQQ